MDLGNLRGGGGVGCGVILAVVLLVCFDVVTI